MSDLQVVLGLWPGFGQQPDSAPEASFEQHASEPVEAVAEHADGARQPATSVPMIGSQRLWRRTEIAWCDATIEGVLHSGAIGQGQQGGHRQHQPVAGDAGRVGAPGLVPFPAQALDGLEAQFDPEAQGVPADPDLLRRQVGEDDPGFLLLGVPDGQQGATAALWWVGRRRCPGRSRRYRTGKEGARGQTPATLGRRR